MQNATPESVVELLNEALKLDNSAIQKLFQHRVECNEAMADHENIMVRSRSGKFTLGFLGLLNGMFPQVNGMGSICISVEGDEIIEFAVTKPTDDIVE